MNFKKKVQIKLELALYALFCIDPIFFLQEKKRIPDHLRLQDYLLQILLDSEHKNVFPSFENQEVIRHRTSQLLAMVNDLCQQTIYSRRTFSLSHIESDSELPFCSHDNNQREKQIGELNQDIFFNYNDLLIEKAVFLSEEQKCVQVQNYLIHFEQSSSFIEKAAFHELDLKFFQQNGKESKNLEFIKIHRGISALRFLEDLLNVI